ncbi:MAG: dolichol-phosphate mannosyltransferase [Chloroflexota bacterium]|nr:dolichol-phosphate mannosyltransferase [Chloroflexota bacterium]
MIWILLPAYNEETDLPNLLVKIKDVMAGQEYRLVVVNDGSTDSTANILEKSKNDLNLVVLEHPINRGLGETERDGFEYIAWHAERDDYLVRVEGDDTHEPKYMFSMIDKLNQGYDVVNTSRFQPGGGQMGVNGYRAFISRMANLFMRMVFSVKGVRDYSCGFRAYRVAVIQDALTIYGNNLIQMRGLGFTSTLEIIVKLNVMGCRFAEVPFVLRYDQKQGGSKMIGSVTMLGYLTMGMLYWWPFGGWRKQYRGLNKLYREDPQAAVETYRLGSLKKRRTASQINI